MVSPELNHSRFSELSLTEFKFQGSCLSNRVRSKSIAVGCTLRKLRNHGLQGSELVTVCRATLVSRLVYAFPSWWGPTTNEKLNKLQAVSDRAYR